MNDCCTGASAAPSRRAFIQTAALGAGVTLMFGAAPIRAWAAGHCEYLLLTCMDYRFPDKITAYMNERGLHEDYDHVVLAGASLGVLQKQKPNWAPTFWDHVAAAIDLHKISKVMVLDHWECGAYKLFLGQETWEDHVACLNGLKAQLNNRQPALSVELGVMMLDGTVRPVGAVEPAAKPKRELEPAH